MAPKLDKDARYTEIDSERLSRAWSLVESSPDLRFLFRVILGEAGVQSPVYGESPTQLARSAGKQELGLQLIVAMNSVCPLLYPTLLLEEARELQDRKAPVERPE